jgi:hypothetical protein
MDEEGQIIPSGYRHNWLDNVYGEEHATHCPPAEHELQPCTEEEEQQRPVKHEPEAQRLS